MVRLPQKNAEGIRQMHVCSSDLAPPSPFLERCIADLFEPEGCGKAKPVYTFTSVLILCIAPLFAAWIIQAWRPSKGPWSFWFSSIFSVMIAAIGFLTLCETDTPIIPEPKA